MDIIFKALSLIPFYALGAFPTGHLIARYKGVDIHNQGSGNVGATNVARVIGKKAGALVLVVDVAKGILSTALGWFLTSSVSYTAAVAFATVLGHCVSFPPKLKGGKGVATALGVLLFQMPLVAGIAVVVFASAYMITEIVAISSIAAAIGASIATLILDQENSIIVSTCLISLLIVYRHRSNLKNLSQGTEPKFK